MKILSLSEAKKKLSALVDAVRIGDEEVVITKDGKPAAVLMSPRAFESLQESQLVLSDAQLMSEVTQGLEALREQNVPLYTLEDLFEETPQDGG